jgi:hypothetical protein
MGAAGAANINRWWADHQALKGKVRSNDFEQVQKTF